MTQQLIYVDIKAEGVDDNGNGTFTLKLAGAAVSNEDTKVLARLFPNLGEAAYRLLNQEALLASLATPAEVHAPKHSVPASKCKAKAPFPVPLTIDVDDDDYTHPVDLSHK